MKTKLITSLLFFASISLLSLTVGCSKANSDYNNNPAPGGTPGANEVWLQGTAFTPSTLTVTANTTVKWTNKDSFAHTVTSDSTMFDSGNLTSAGTYNFKFTTKGTYKYHCNIHPMMKGTIIVK